eukprot:4251563-Amphidinium_carterae.1
MHSTTMSEVQAELEALAASTPKFKKIETPEFGVEALGFGPQSNSAPMDTGKPNFPVPARSCGDCGHANAGMPPPGLYTPLPSHGLLQQTSSAAATSPAVPGLNFSRLSGTGSGCGASFLQDHPVDNELEEIFPTMMTTTMTTVLDQVDVDALEYRWCVKCSKNLLHLECLKALGRPIAECLRCEEIKIKKQGVHGGGGEPPHDPDDPDDFYGGKPGWPKDGKME